MPKTPSAFDLALNGLLGFIQNEMGRGRITAIQSQILTWAAETLEREHRNTITGYEERLEELRADVEVV